MYKEIQIGGQSVALLANAATPIRYKQVFHRDLIHELADSQKDPSITVSITPNLAYLMAQQAAKVDMMALNEDTFITWLEKFEATDFIGASDGIWAVWSGTAATEAKPKKKNDRQSGN